MFTSDKFIKSLLSSFIYFSSAHLYKDTGVQRSTHTISFEFNSFYTVYISESRKALKCFWKKNSATKRLLCSDGSFRRRRKSQPEAARPTSIRRLDLQAFRIHAPDRKTLRPRAPPVPCHESPDSESAPAWPQSPGTHLLCLQHRPDSIKD